MPFLHCHNLVTMQETAKFRTSIVKMLAAEPSVAGAKEKLADVCSKVPPFAIYVVCSDEVATLLEA